MARAELLHAPALVAVDAAAVSVTALVAVVRPMDVKMEQMRWKMASYAVRSDQASSVSAVNRRAAVLLIARAAAVAAVAKTVDYAAFPRAVGEHDQYTGTCTCNNPSCTLWDPRFN